jgi:hypothetical protein
MYSSHPKLNEPLPDTSLWRYMDFAKFIEILETGTLFFPRLTSFQDPFEGHPPRMVVETFRAVPTGLSEHAAAQRRAVTADNSELFRNSRQLVCASCWHANDTESAAMWNLYLKSGEGIAVRTTFQRLVNALSASGPNISDGMVQYVDYETFEPNDVNILVWAVLKRLSFIHENEFRLLILNDTTSPEGISVPVNVDSLIEHVYVSPTTPDWMVRLLVSLLKRYGLSKPIIRSDLNTAPGYYGET